LCGVEWRRALLTLSEVLGEQLLGPIRPALLLLLHIAKELHQFLVAALLGVLDVLLVGLGTLQRNAGPPRRERMASILFAMAASQPDPVPVIRADDALALARHLRRKEALA
jgi:hypothetical protein